MIKKLTRIATTFSLLMAGYLVYVQGFAVVAGVFAARTDVPVLPFDPAPSRSSLEARELAKTAFGPGHFSHNAKIRYYDAAKGYWIYTQDYKRKDDGKRIELEPFALIWRSKHGRALKTVTADRAILVFNEAPDMMKGSGREAHIVHARIEGDVHIRDDKGTPANLGDDMTIELAHVEFDERTQQVSSDSPVVIRERDAVATGEDLEIMLISADASAKGNSVAGFQGAKSIKLKHNVHITVGDVGRTGIVPGGSLQPETKKGKREPRPGEIRCAGELLIELPPPRPEGTTAPDDPTFAHFSRDVIVAQGDAQNPDQLNCDQLHLTLYPQNRAEREAALRVAAARAEKASSEGGATTDPATADGGPVSNLTLRQARATGHAVWLQSKLRDAVAFGNELDYRKGQLGEPDVTYFRGAKWTEIRKQNTKEGTVDVIRTTDVTLYHTGESKDTMSIVARGPGWLETRSLADESVSRKATWADQCVMQPVADDPRRRRLTLQGNPEIRDNRRGFMQASNKIVASLVSHDPPPDAQSAEPAETGSFGIEVMQAWGTVTLVSNNTAPEGASPTASPLAAGQRTITAREWLGVVFEEGTASTAPTTDQPAPAAVAQADQGEPAAEKAPADAGLPPKNEPPLTVSADRIWAWVKPTESAAREPKKQADSPDKQSWDIREVRLRGRVVVHQDARPDKKRGLDVEGEEVDVTALGEKLFKMRAGAGAVIPASVSTEEFYIEGRLLELDQSIDEARVEGYGKLVQRQAGGGMLGDTASGAPKKQGPLTIAWGRDATGAPLPAVGPDGRPIKPIMRFYGRSVDDRGLPGPAFAHFNVGVRAWTNDSVLTCNDMKAYLDGPIDFANTKGLSPGMPSQAGEPSASAQSRISRIECRNDVDILTRKWDTEGLLVEKRRIRGDFVEYERATNEFHVRSPGIVDLYDRKDGSLVPGGQKRADSRAKPTNVDLRKRSGPEPLRLTRIWFEKEMKGQIYSTPTGRGHQAGQAEFFGTPRMANAIAADEDADVDPDNLPAGGMYCAADTIRVISEPAPAGAPETSADRVVLQAWGELYGLSRTERGDMAMRANDHMDYNSETGLSYVYGGELGVTIVEQSGVGQQASYARGSTIIFNHKTGEHKLLDARSFVLVDPNSGIRAGIPPVPPDRKPQKPKRKLYPLINRGQKERANFTGR